MARQILGGDRFLTLQARVGGGASHPSSLLLQTRFFMQNVEEACRSVKEPVHSSPRNLGAIPVLQRNDAGEMCRAGRDAPAAASCSTGGAGKEEASVSELRGDRGCFNKFCPSQTFRIRQSQRLTYPLVFSSQRVKRNSLLYLPVYVQVSGVSWLLRVLCLAMCGNFPSRLYVHCTHSDLCRKKNRRIWTHSNWVPRQNISFCIHLHDMAVVTLSFAASQLDRHTSQGGVC